MITLSKLKKNSLGINVAISVLSMLIILYFLFNLWHTDLGVPFNYWGDTLWYLAPVKSIIQNGWTYDIPQLSAPFGLSAAGFPSMTNLDWLAMKIISTFTSNPSVVLNIFWLSSIVFTAGTTTVALHLGGVKGWLSVAGAIIYALLPFAFLRNVAHISLVYYTIPLLSITAIAIANEANNKNGPAISLAGYFAIIAQGLGYIYFSFFAIILFAFAGLLGFMRTKSVYVLKNAAMACGLLMLVASINLVPSFHSWYEHGKPPDMGYKSAKEAETYGLKIRKMLAPHSDNIIPGLGHWGKADKAAAFPNENENATARLGPMAAVGFLLLLAVSLGITKSILPNNEKTAHTLTTTASLSLFTLLFITTGGFGAVFNLIAPDIRAYNRFSVFIAFFSLLGLLLWLQYLFNSTQSSGARLLMVVLTTMLISTSLYDQLLDAGDLKIRRVADENSVRNEREFVRLIEAIAPNNSKVFQLPITRFPLDAGRARMLPYDHARPYLWSQHLSWSWPSFSQENQLWLDQLNAEDEAQMVQALVLSGFQLIWIDRFGYHDGGETIIAALRAIGVTPIAEGRSSRYEVFDLAKVSARTKLQLGDIEFRKQSEQLLNPSITVAWREGFFEPEQNPTGRHFRWSRANSMIEVSNLQKVEWRGKASFYLASGTTGSVEVSTDGYRKVIAVAQDPTLVEIPLIVSANTRISLNFASNTGRINTSPEETRDLHFLVMSLGIKEFSNGLESK